MKTVLITGVGRGIGLALAKKFLEGKYFVIGTFGTTKPNLSDKDFISYPLKLDSADSIEHCVESLRKDGRIIDVVINNAGVLLDRHETVVHIENLRRTLDVNLIGTIDFTEQLLPLITSRGHIINISSRVGSLELAGSGQIHHPFQYPSYKISKAALNMYTRTLALRLKEQGIIVSSVHPGWVRTEMGGQEADISPEVAAQQIYEFAISNPETGGFWYAGSRLPW